MSPSRGIIAAALHLSLYSRMWGVAAGCGYATAPKGHAWGVPPRGLAPAQPEQESRASGCESEGESEAGAGYLAVCVSVFCLRGARI